MLVALCHFYPGYTLESLRRVTLRDLNVLIRMRDEAQEAMS